MPEGQEEQLVAEPEQVVHPPVQDVQLPAAVSLKVPEGQEDTHWLRLRYVFAGQESQVVPVEQV